MSTVVCDRIDTLARSIVAFLSEAIRDLDGDTHAVGSCSDRSEIVFGAVKEMLRDFATTVNTVYPPILRDEYTTLMDEVGRTACDDDIVAVLVGDAAWTEGGAGIIVQLARRYGTSILRNALALAEAMNVEDGSDRY